MKAARVVIGSISILVFGIGVATAVLNGLANDEVAVNAETVRRSVLPIAFCAAFAGAGLASIAGRNQPGADVTAAGFYWLAALIGLAGWLAGDDMVIWAVPVVAWALVAGIAGVALVLSPNS